MLTQVIRRQREEHITRFRVKINKLQQALQRSAQPDNINVIASQIGQVDWNRLIDVEKQPEKSRKNKFLVARFLKHE